MTTAYIVDELCELAENLWFLKQNRESHSRRPRVPPDTGEAKLVLGEGRKESRRGSRKSSKRIDFCTGEFIGSAFGVTMLAFE